MADVDGDGDLDVLSANGRHWAQVSHVYLNNGGLLLQKRPIDADEGGTAYQIVAADFDGDGDADAAIVRDQIPSTLFLNDGSGHFGQRTTFGQAGPARGAAAGDIDGDGFTDLIVSLRSGVSYVAYGARRRPLSRVATFGAPQATVGVALGDLDGDGDLDAIFAERGDRGLLVSWNDRGLGAMTPLPLELGDTRYVALADFDGDGRLDIAAARTQAPLIIIYNRGDRRWEAGPEIGPANGGYYGVAAFDLDHDGDTDLATARVGGDEYVFFQQDGCWTGEAIEGTGGDTYHVAAGDLNGDGYADLVFSNSEDRNVIVRVRPSE